MTFFQLSKETERDGGEGAFWQQRAPQQDWCRLQDSNL